MPLPNPAPRAMRMTGLSLRLRTKFLLSLVLTTAGLSCATLLIVRHDAQQHVQQDIVAATRNSLLTFQVLIHQREIALSRKADLLATIARVSASDPATFENSIGDPLQTEGTDLVGLADPLGKFTVFRTTNPSLQIGTTGHMLLQSMRQGRTTDWWIAGGSVYQVALQPIDRNQRLSKSSSGIAVVGQEIDYRSVRDLGRISASEVAFTHGNDVIVSTFAPLEEQELGQHLQDWSTPRQIQLGDERYYAGSVNLTRGSEPAAQFVVLKSYNQATAFLERLNHLLLALGAIAVFVGTVLAFVISDTFTRPLGNLVNGVHALEHGDFQYPLEAHGGDEVAHVTRAFDRMRNTLQKNETQKEQLEDQLRQSQKMEALGRLAGGVAHDFNNLLTVIKGHSELLLQGLSPADPLADSTQHIRKAADRAASLTRQMLAFSRRQVLQPKVLNLNTLVDEMSRLLKRLIHEDIEFTFKPEAALGRVRADAGQVEQVVLNLIVNSCDAMPTGGKLQIETRNVEIDSDPNRPRPTIEPGHYVMLSVKDTGHGMDPDTQTRMFDPFFTTKDKDKGTGLGLATVYGVVKQSGGFIWVESVVGQGTRIEVYLPQAAEESGSRVTQTKATPAVRAAETVLLAEDETEVRSLASQFLQSAGYRVIAAQDGAEALEMASRFGEPIDLLVTDVVMPKMRGPELAQKLKDRLPKLKIVYMSGYLEPADGDGDLLEGAQLIQKPFSRDALVQRANEALRNGLSQKAVQPT